MTIANPTITFTPEDLLRLEDGVKYELVDGQLVERHMSMESSKVGARVLTRIGIFLLEHPIGDVFGADAGFQCFPDAPSKVRKSDVSFVRAERFPAGGIRRGYCPVPPDLAVEVTSPGDLAYEIDEKVIEYLTAGVPLVWVVSPPTRTVRIHRPAASSRGPISQLAGDEAITGEDVLPEFSCKVSEFF